MKRSLNFLRSLCAVALLSLPALGAVGCGDDTPAPQPGPDGTSEVTFANAHLNYAGAAAIRFRRLGLDVASLTYGQSSEATVENGSTTFKVLLPSGAELGSTTLTLDSGQRVAVLLSGDGTQNDVYTVSTAVRDAPPGNAAVRIINASPNSGGIDIKVNSINGLDFTSALPYKSGTTYRDLPVSTNRLVITKAGGDTTAMLTLADSTANMASGKRYAIIVYGSADPNAQASAKLNAVVVEE